MKKWTAHGADIIDEETGEVLLMWGGSSFSLEELQLIAKLPEMVRQFALFREGDMAAHKIYEILELAKKAGFLDD